VSRKSINDAEDMRRISGPGFVEAMHRTALPADVESSVAEPPPRQERIRFYMPSELRNYKHDGESILVGDCHIMRGATAVIGGEPGVGKSRAATALAVAGATGGDWLGLPVHRRFKTMIVQTENGLHRLQQEFAALDIPDLDEWVRVSEPPPFGLTLGHPEFLADIKAALDAFKPDCVVLDPWNSAAKDDKQRDYTETFEALRNMLPTGEDKPALVIVAHTRKPAQAEKRSGGTALMHNLAGSHVLTSVPRSVFVMTRASEDETSDIVLWFNPKCNDGKHCAPGAWHRTESGFIPAEGFDWERYNKTTGDRKAVTLAHLEQVFAGGKRLELGEAAHRLATLAGITRNSAYNALGSDGRFAEHVKRKGRILYFSAETDFSFMQNPQGNVDE